MSPIPIILASGLSALVPLAPVAASQIDWGNALSASDVNFSSEGTALDVSYTFALGTFGDSFQPDAGNTGLWDANWKEMDTADYNPLFDYFTAETMLSDNSLFTAGENAYIWIYNSRTAGESSEWLLMRGSTWDVPATTGSQTELPLQWRASGADQLIYGGKDDVQGPGGFTVIPASFKLQTHSLGVVPEPATIVLAAALGSVLALRRRRRLRCAGPPTRIRRASVVWVVLVLAPAGSAEPPAYEIVPAAAIPDNDPEGAARTITVPEHFIITGLTLGVTITHPSRGGISLQLTSPGGTTITVIASGADSAANYDVRLSDGAPGPLNDGDADNPAPPFYERAAIPSNSLDIFVGEDAAGAWTVIATDLASGATGTLDRLELAFACPEIFVASDPLPLDVAFIGVPFAGVISTDGGIGLSTIAITAGTLPDGLLLDPFTGALTGTPTGPPGTHALTVTVTDAYGCTGGADFDLEVSVPPAMAAGNLVFLDLDGDGRWNPETDPGVDGVRVQIFAEGDFEVPVGPDGILDSPDDAPGGTLTRDGGIFFFRNLPEGNYYLLIPASEFAPGGPLCGTVSALPDLAGDNLDDDADENGLNASDPAGTGIRTSVFELAAATEPVGESGRATAQDDDDNTNLTIDFGFVRTARVGSRVWLDEDSDGRENAGERGLPNVTVILRDSGGAALATVSTDAAGNYGFTVPPGTYRIRVDESTLPPGFTQTSVHPELGSDLVNQNQNTGLGYLVTLPPDGENLTADFGYNANPTNEVDGAAGSTAIGDRIWIDVDGDGHQDPAEPGLGGVTVRLFRPGADHILGTPDDTLSASLPTDALGYFLFQGLPPGAFMVSVDPASLPPGFVLTGDPDVFGASGGASDHATTVPLVMAPGDVYLNADFGYQPPSGMDNRCGGTVWFNSDDDFFHDGAEWGFARVSVSLILDLSSDATWDADEPIVATTTTDADGHYEFSGLSDGSYLIAVGDAANVLAGFRPSLDSDGIATPGLASVLLDEMGTSDTAVTDFSQNFGYASNNHNHGELVIGDSVWLDFSLDGVFDPDEFPIEGVQVRLLIAGMDSVFGTVDDIVVGSTATNEDGRYAFGGLGDGTYLVAIDPPAGLSPTADADGLVTPNQSVVILSAGEPPNLDQDFGLHAELAGTIGNFVFLDANADGQGDPDGADDIIGTDDDEPGLAGITLDLFLDRDADSRLGPADTLFAHATTDALGGYLFTGLPLDHHYLVDVTDRDGLLAGHSLTRSNGEGPDASRVDPTGAELTPESPDSGNVDFGFTLEPAAIGNRIWFDRFSTGSQLTGSTDLSDVLVRLAIDYPDGSLTELETRSTADGFYSFGNLLLDEDFRQGTSDAPAGAGLPRFTLTVPTAQSALTGLKPTLIDKPGVDDSADSEDPAGTVVIVTRGLSDVQAHAPPSDEGPAAGLDFGFRTLQPLLYDAFIAGNDLADADALPVPDEDGFGGNPDRDASNNLIEYFSASPPRSGINPVCSPEINADPLSGLINFCVRRVAGLYDVVAVLEAAGTLGSPTDWTDMTVEPTVTPHPDGTETACYQDLESFGPAFADGDGFVRLRLELYPPEEEIPIAVTHTGVFGYVRRPVPGAAAGIEFQSTTLGTPFLGCVALSATVTDNSATLLDLSGSLAADDADTAFDSVRRYFIEVTDGPFAGHRFEVAVGASPPGALAIDTSSPVNTLVLAEGMLADSSVVVRRHWTLDDLFPPARFLAGSEPLDSDSILTHSPAGWRTFWLASLGENNHRWVAGNEASLADKGTHPIAPAEGVFVQRRGPAIDFVFAGAVRENPFACPLRQGCTLLGNGFPMTGSFDSRGMSAAAGFVGSDDLPTADHVLLWLGDSIPGSTAYATSFLLDAGPPFQYWTSADESTGTNLNAEPLFDPTRAAFHCSQHGLATFLIPAPWSP